MLACAPEGTAPGGEDPLREADIAAAVRRIGGAAYPQCLHELRGLTVTLSTSIATATATAKDVLGLPIDSMSFVWQARPRPCASPRT